MGIVVLWPYTKYFPGWQFPGVSIFVDQTWTLKNCLKLLSHYNPCLSINLFSTSTVYRCESLQAPASGSVTCDHTSPIAGTQCTLECNTGYTLSRSQSRTCQLTSDDTPYWDGQNTVCTSEWLRLKSAYTQIALFADANWKNPWSPHGSPWTIFLTLG